MRLSHTTVAAIVAALIFAAVAQAKDHATTALNIVPSGQYGAVPAPPGADLQAHMYAGLTPLYDQVTAADLTKFFKPEVLGTAGSCPCHKELVPKKGITIVRDRFDVPHISARSRDLLTWATGWVLQEDRSLLLSVGRYPARLAAIDAPNTTAFSLVAGVKSVVPSKQTEDFIDRQTSVLARTAAGRSLLVDIDHYVDGINARLRHDKSKEKPWSRIDVYAVNALIGQIFGEGGGDEPARAMFLDALRKRLGAASGQTLFDDLSEHVDGDSPATIDKTFSFLPVPKVQTGNAILDDGSLRRVPSANQLAGLASAAVADSTPAHMSNFLMVAAKRSTTGHPIFVAGPQIGYFYPGLTLEMDLKAPGIEARGVTAPGFPGTLLIGRGQDNAWTLTSAGSDNIDHFVETLCGGATTKYMYKGKCRSMGTFNAGTVAGKPLRFRTTVHGPVIGYATVKGRKVAISRKRSSSGRDIEFQFPFRDMTFGVVHNAREFMRSFAQSPFTFNVGYADDRDIAMYSAGLLPNRDPRVDPRLPTIGDGRFEWRGYLRPAAHAQQINAADGTLVNWNNRPAPGWGAADDNWSYGSVHRVQMLDAGLARSQMQSPESVVAAMNRAATTDLRVEKVFPVIEEILRTGPAPSAREDRMIQLVDAFRTAGPAWLDRDNDGKVDLPGAAIADAIYPRVIDAVLGGALGPQLDALKRFAGANADTGNDFTGGNLGYVEKDLRQLLGRPVTVLFKTRFCGAGNLDQCRTALWEAVRAAGDALATAQGTNNPDDWRAIEPTITFAPVNAFKIPYTNRPSGIQQVLSFTGHRPPAP